MIWIASFDIGSSAVKAALVGRDGALRHARTVDYPHEAQRNEQGPGVWWNAWLAALASWWAAGIDPSQIAAVTFSGQMQALIALDASGQPLRPAWLHADARAAEEAQALRATLSAATIEQVTRNPFNATSVLPKMLHLRVHDPVTWARTARLLFGAKDFIALQLTGRAVVDPTSAATTGLFNLEAGRWQTEWFAALGLEPGLLPQLLEAGALAGEVTPQAAALTGLTAGCPVMCGVGDAAATTLGAGVVEAGQSYAYIGTSAWVARVSAAFNPPDLPLFVLPYLSRAKRIRIGPVSNAGGVHRWALELLDRGAPEAEFGAPERFDAFERAVLACSSDPHLLFLPYLAGERLPIVTAEPRGTFSGLSLATTREQMMRAALEGISMSLRGALDLLGGETTASLVVVGGATRSAAWMQILADVFDAELRVASDADLLPCLGAAALAAVALGWCGDAPTFVQRRAAPAERRYAPDASNASLMRRKVADWRRLQTAIATLGSDDA